MASVDVVRFAGRKTRWVFEGAVRWLENGNNCRLNDIDSVCNLSQVLDKYIKVVLKLPGVWSWLPLTAKRLSSASAGSRRYGVQRRPSTRSRQTAFKL